MKRTIKITEKDINNIVKKVLKEQTNPPLQAKPAAAPPSQFNDRIANIASMLASVEPKQVTRYFIKTNNPKLNGKEWSWYVRTYKITPQEIQQSKQLMAKLGTKNPMEILQQYNFNQQLTGGTQTSGTTQTTKPTASVVPAGGIKKV